MKQYVLLLAALALTGCAYGKYKTSYLQEYASNDCRDLMTEQVLADLELQRIQEEYRGPSRGVLGPTGGVGFAPSPSQKWRMQNHARRQAIQQLENSQGCRNEEAAPIS